MADYQIKPIAVKRFADANGVHENNEGFWLGEIEWESGDTAEAGREVVAPYCDDDGGFIPAPANWRDLIVRQL